jgi:hypothetical protein
MPEWSAAGKAIQKKFAFKSFMPAIAFVNKIAEEELRSRGVKELMSRGVQESRSSGVEESRSRGVQESRSREVEESRS